MKLLLLLWVQFENRLSLLDNTGFTQVYLYYTVQNDGKWEDIADTTWLINGKFSFAGSLSELTKASIVSEEGLDISFYLEPADIKLSIDRGKQYLYDISGTSVDDENIALRNTLLPELKSLNEKRETFYKLFELINLHADEPAVTDSLYQIVYQEKEGNTLIIKRLDDLRLDFVTQHSTYKIAPDILYSLAMTNNVGIDTVKHIYNSLPEQSKTSLLGRLAAAQIELTERESRVKDIAVGDTAPEFARRSIQGDTIRLSDYKGKNYVLLDFWASWCAPCIKGIPQVKEIYNKYNKQGLVVIGLSLDVKEQDWSNAIDEFKIKMMPQILSFYNLDDNYFGNEGNINEIYNVKSIPQYMLIDKQGKVIARWQHIGQEEINFIAKLVRE